jgi:hypothetical protein
MHSERLFHKLPQAPLLLNWVYIMPLTFRVTIKTCSIVGCARLVHVRVLLYYHTMESGFVEYKILLLFEIAPCYLEAESG